MKDKVQRMEESLAVASATTAQVSQLELELGCDVYALTISCDQWRGRDLKISLQESELSAREMESSRDAAKALSQVCGTAACLVT